jgi:hypothetical protein
MTATGYHDVGEEFIQKTSYRQDNIGTRPASVDVLLFNDGTDALSDSSDVGDITTEPSSGNYSRQTVTLDDADVSLSQTGGNIEASASVSFDTTNSTQTVDAYAVVVNFTSDIVNSEGSPNDHLLTSSEFNSGVDRNLDGISSFDLDLNIQLN